jgi:proteasome lid subunit RPN8/RPN11
MIQIPKESLDTMITWVQEGYPFECCGILGGKADKNEVVSVLPAKNLNEDRKKDRYLMNPADIVKAEKAFRDSKHDILGYYHSHPDHGAYFSETDRANGWPEYFYIVFSVMKGKVEEYKCWRMNKKTEQFEEEEIKILEGAKE